MPFIKKKINIVLNVFKKIKTRWGISSNFQFIIILIVFAITGSLSLYLSQPILDMLNINNNINHQLLYYSIRLAIIFPIYQIILIVIGSLLGQFNFFWNLEKKTMNRIFKMLIKDNKLN